MSTSTPFESGPACAGDYALLVEFTPGGKGYSYLASRYIAPGSKVYVASPVQPDPAEVTVLDCKKAGPLNRGKKILKHPNGVAARTYQEACDILSETKEPSSEPATADPDCINKLTTKLYYSKPTTQNTPRSNGMISIKTATYVNGVDVRKLSNNDIMTLIADANARIEQLEKTDPRPNRLNKEVEKLRDGVQQLVKLLDEIDAEDSKDQDSAADAD